MSRISVGRGWRRRRDEVGAVAIVTAVLFASVLLGLAAIGVDTARWYVEAERAQKAADAAALAGVVYLPDNFSQARATAIESARLNGFDDRLDDVVVTVEFGERRSQLRVTIDSTIDNQFGAAIGVDRATIGRSSVADYTSPAPMGSPCNAFGNEPPGGNNRTTGSGASGPRGTQIPDSYRSSGICSEQPNFWAAVEGPETDKQQGDRYSTAPCTLKSDAGKLPYGCEADKNTEAIHPEGYFFVIKVPEGAQNRAITLQLFDPAFVATGANCSSMPNSDGGDYLSNINPYVTTQGSNRIDELYDAYARYTDPTKVSSEYRAYARWFCTGDSRPGRARTAPSNRVTAPVTSFAIRRANAQQDPTAGAPVSGCTAQFSGQQDPPTLDELRERTANGRSNPAYLEPAAQVFHQWVTLCTFTPDRAGDYYLQVRTNAALPNGARPHEYVVQGNRVVEQNRPGTFVYRGNTAVTSPAPTFSEGEGVNAFGIRAISSAAGQISVSGWNRMPMLQNVPDSTATFNLLRVLPAAAGQTIAFEFYDVADGANDIGRVQVIPPKRLNDTQPPQYTNCQGALNDEDFAPVDSDCSVRVSNSSHNGQVQRLAIPIPSTYTCKENELTGCWFRVKITLNGNITDFTTWNASLQGDPVRLIE